MVFYRLCWMAILVLFFRAGTTDACSASPDVFATSVDGMSTYPANAAVLLEVRFYDLSDFAIEVNGIPGQLTYVPELSYKGEVLNYMVPEPSILAAQISPEPAEGDTLKLQVVGCEPYCDAVTWIWTAGPSDTTPPASLLSEFSFHLYQYPAYVTGNSCEPRYIQHSWFFYPQGTGSEGTSIELYRLEVTSVAAPETLLFTDTWYQASAFSKERRWDTMLPDEGDAATSLCFRLTPMDLASNTGPYLTTCKPHYCRIETQPLPVTEETPPPPQEPVWTDEDLFAEGKCRTMPTATPETPTPSAATPTDSDDGASPGCGCTHAGMSAARAGMGAVVWAAALCAHVAPGRRRRRRSGTYPARR